MLIGELFPCPSAVRCLWGPTHTHLLYHGADSSSTQVQPRTDGRHHALEGKGQALPSHIVVLGQGSQAQRSLPIWWPANSTCRATSTYQTLLQCKAPPSARIEFCQENKVDEGPECKYSIIIGPLFERQWDLDFRAESSPPPKAFSFSCALLFIVFHLFALLYFYFFGLFSLCTI